VCRRRQQQACSGGRQHAALRGARCPRHPAFHKLAQSPFLREDAGAFEGVLWLPWCGPPRQCMWRAGVTPIASCRPAGPRHRCAWGTTPNGGSMLWGCEGPLIRRIVDKGPQECLPCLPCA
jgi:hypothetical protein